MASLVAQIVKNLPAMRETWVQSLGQEDRGNATHPSILAWRIPGTEKPGGLQSQTYVYTHTHTHTHTHTESVSPFHHGHNIFYTPLLGQYLPKGKEKSQKLQHTPGIFSVKLIRKESTTISLPNPSKLNMLISVHLKIN